MQFQTLAALRFGFGVPSGAPESVDAMLEALGGPDQSARDWPIEGLAAVLPAVQAAQAEKAAAIGRSAMPARPYAAEAPVPPPDSSTSMMSFVSKCNWRMSFRNKPRPRMRLPPHTAH